MTPPTPHITPRAAPRRVLEDASGRRLLRMRWVGRAVALLFLIWLAVVILGGLGVGPVARLPFGHVLRPTAGPPPLRHALHPRQAAPADLVPALPAPVATPSAAARATHGKSSLAPGRTTTTVTTPGRSGSAPGQAKKTTTTTTVTSPGKSASAPGHKKTTTTVTTTPGRSGSAPGKTTTVTTTTVPTTPGKSHVLGKKP